MTTLVFTTSQTWTVPAYSSMTVTVEAAVGPSGAPGPNGADLPGGDGTIYSYGGAGGPGGAGGYGGKAVKTYTSSTGPAPGATVQIRIERSNPELGLESDFNFGASPPTAFDGGMGGTGGAGGDGTYDGNGAPGAAGSPGINGSASGGDTNTTGGSSRSSGTVTIVYTPITAVNVAITGVAGTGALGALAITKTGNAVVAITGVAGSSALGSPSVAMVASRTVALSGAAATGSVNVPTATIVLNPVTLTFTNSQNWTVPGYSSMTITVEGGQGQAGAPGANGADQPGGDGTIYSYGGAGGPGGAGGNGGKAVVTWTRANGPAVGSSLPLTIDGLTPINAGYGSRVPFSGLPTAYDGGPGGNGGNGGDASYDGAGAPGAPGATGADGTASGGDTNTAGGSTKNAPTITITYTPASLKNVGLTGQQGFGQSGTPGVSIFLGPVVTPVGQQGASAIGSLAPVKATSFTPTGVQGLGRAGAPTLFIKSTIPGVFEIEQGLQATGAVGVVAISRPINNPTVALTGARGGGASGQPSPVVTGIRRISMGRQADNSMGLRISQAGYDVRANPVDQTKLIFNSDWGQMMQVYMTGTFLHRDTTQNGQRIQTIIDYPTLGYVPFAEIFLAPLTNTPDYVPIMPLGYVYNRNSCTQLYVNTSYSVNVGDMRCAVSASQIYVNSYTPGFSGPGFSNSSTGYPTSYRIFYAIYRKQAS